VTLVYCSQTVEWIMMPLGTEVGLDLGDIDRWGPSSPWTGAQQSLHFSAHFYCGETAVC